MLSGTLVQEAADNNCVYRNEVHHTAAERTQVLQDVAGDPTLPRTKTVKCAQCGHPEAVFFQVCARGLTGKSFFVSFWYPLIRLFGTSTGLLSETLFFFILIFCFPGWVFLVKFGLNWGQGKHMPFSLSLVNRTFCNLGFWGWNLCVTVTCCYANCEVVSSRDIPYQNAIVTGNQGTCSVTDSSNLVLFVWANNFAGLDCFLVAYWGSADANLD